MLCNYTILSYLILSINRRLLNSFDCLFWVIYLKIFLVNFCIVKQFNNNFFIFIFHDIEVSPNLSSSWRDEELYVEDYCDPASIVLAQLNVIVILNFYFISTLQLQIISVKNIKIKCLPIDPLQNPFGILFFTDSFNNSLEFLLNFAADW